MTQRIIDVAYRPQARTPWHQPTNYARTLLILALAAAGLGDLDQAVTAGTAALDCGRIVWPTMVLAGKLDLALTRQYPRAASNGGFPRLLPRRGHPPRPGSPAPLAREGPQMTDDELTLQRVAM